MRPCKRNDCSPAKQTFSLPVIALFDGCGYRQDSRTRGGKECGWLVVEDDDEVMLNVLRCQLTY